jgi:ribokinase
MTSSPDVVVVGSCNYDQFVYVPNFPKPGATIYGTAYSTGFGGKGANQAVMAAKMGAPTAIVGALGSDQVVAIGELLYA